ncbi:MAG: hypothetical protein L7S64_00345 [Longimicrobiales bacterium]|nr:hypothetical protein [Longimicrobiales bacterium]
MKLFDRFEEARDWAFDNLKGYPAHRVVWIEYHSAWAVELYPYGPLEPR